MQRIILHPTATGLAQRQTALCAATLDRDLRINGLNLIGRSVRSSGHAQHSATCRGNPLAF